MDLRNAIKLNIDMAATVCNGYLEDLSDEELMRRPHPGCNHIMWQLGHLISSEYRIMEAVDPGSIPPLPEGFAEKYTKETASNDDPTAFHSKDELLRLAKQQREATLASLERKSDEDLGAEAPEFIRGFAPTVAAAYSLQGSHWMMHAGQWVVVRRQLGKPVLF